jgi:hypothetical protein
MAKWSHPVTCKRVLKLTWRTSRSLSIVSFSQIAEAMRSSAASLSSSQEASLALASFLRVLRVASRSATRAWLKKIGPLNQYF